MKLIEWYVNLHIAIRDAWRNKRVVFEINIGECLFLAAFLYWLFNRG